MELSYFLAQLIGITIAIFSVAGLIRPQLISAAVRDFDHESFSTLAIGMIATGTGVAIVLSHNLWVGDWRVLITIYGWAALIKGTLYMLAPNKLIHMSRMLLRDKMWTRGSLLVCLILGVYLAYKGFGN